MCRYEQQVTEEQQELCKLVQLASKGGVLGEQDADRKKELEAKFRGRNARCQKRLAKALAKQRKQREGETSEQHAERVKSIHEDEVHQWSGWRIETGRVSKDATLAHHQEGCEFSFADYIGAMSSWDCRYCPRLGAAQVDAQDAALPQDDNLGDDAPRDSRDDLYFRAVNYDDTKEIEEAADGATPAILRNGGYDITPRSVADIP